MEENNPQIRNHVSEQTHKNLEQLHTRELNNMPEIVKNILGDIFTQGNMSFLVGLSMILIYLFASIPNVFLRVRLGSNVISAGIVFVVFMTLQLIGAATEAANFTRAFTGANYHFWHYELLAKLYLLAGTIHCFIIFYRRRFRPEKIVYSFSYGNSWAFPFVQKLTKRLGISNFEEITYQHYIEPLAIFLVGSAIKIGLGYSIGGLIALCGVCSYLSISQQIKNLRREIEMARDAQIVSKSLMLSINSDPKDPQGTSYRGMSINKTLVNEIRSAYANNTEVTEQLQSMIDEQDLS